MSAWGSANAPPHCSGSIAGAIAGTGLAFFFIAQSLIRDYNRESKTPFERIDARWRFYAIFSFVMWAFFFQCLAYALGTLGELSEKWPLALLFANGFVILPVLWLELAYSRTSKELGFTKYYEYNCRKMFVGYFERVEYLEEDGRRRTAESSAGRHFIVLASIGKWLVVYVLTPLTWLHIARNLRNRDLAQKNLKLLQLGQDIVYFLTIWLAVVVSLSALASGIWSKNLGWLVSFLLSVALPFFLLLAAVCALLAFLARFLVRSIGPMGIWPMFLLVFYTIALVLDFHFLGLLGDAPAWPSWLARLAWPTGGIAPWLLLLLLLYMFGLFRVQLREAREVTRKAATLADFALHRFGNLLVPAGTALGLLRGEIETDKNLKRLAADPDRHKEVMRQIENAQGAVRKAQDILLDLKAQARKVPDDHWLSLSGLLEKLAEARQGSVGDWNFQITVEAEPSGLELYIDKDEFEDAVRNLVENARAALEKSPRRDRKVEVRTLYHRTWLYPLIISVKDNGPGIPKSVRDRMYHAGFSTKGGTGLGLYVVNELMQRVGGFVEAFTSTEGDTYSEFQLFFPPERVRLLSRAD